MLQKEVKSDDGTYKRNIYVFGYDKKSGET